MKVPDFSGKVILICAVNNTTNCMKTKTQNHSIFHQIYNDVIKANEEEIKNFNALVRNKKDRNIFYLGIRVLAYDGAFKMQARSDHKKKISLRNIREMEKKVDSYFKSSFRPDQRYYHEQIRQNLIIAELIRDNYESYEEEQFLLEYDDKRRVFASELLQECNIKTKNAKNISVLAFNKIIELANKKISGDLTTIRIECVRFLEDCIEHYFPILLKDLGLGKRVKLLIELRRKYVAKKFNTICNRCGKSLCKKNTRRFCTKLENRICYEAILKDKKTPPLPEVILRTKNLCDFCKKYSSLNNIHRVNKMPMQFCSKKCYEAFRKRRQRKLRKNY